MFAGSASCLFLRLLATSPWNLSTHFHGLRRLFGEEYPSFIHSDFDAAFGNTKRCAEVSEADEESEKRSALRCESQAHLCAWTLGPVT